MLFYFIASCIKRFQLLLGEVNDCADWRVSDCSEGIIYTEEPISMFLCVLMWVYDFFTNYN